MFIPRSVYKKPSSSVIPCLAKETASSSFFSPKPSVSSKSEIKYDKNDEVCQTVISLPKDGSLTDFNEPGLEKKSEENLRSEIKKVKDGIDEYDDKVVESEVKEDERKVKEDDCGIKEGENGINEPENLFGKTENVIDKIENVVEKAEDVIENKAEIDVVSKAQKVVEKDDEIIIEKSGEKAVDKAENVTEQAEKIVTEKAENGNQEYGNENQEDRNKEGRNQEDRSEEDRNKEGGHEKGEEAPIIARSYEQRAAKEGEPICVVCGRFGEYICDTTDDDICSLECKAVVLERANLPPVQIRAAISALSKPNFAQFQTSPPSNPNFPSNSNFRSNPNFPPNPNLSQFQMAVSEGDKMQKQVEKITVDSDWRPHPYIQNLTEMQVNNIRKEMEISVQGVDVPPPILDFSHCQFSVRLNGNLEKAAYEMPTPIQMQAIPAALQNRHILASAQTGSGKTAAFLLPLIHKMCNLQKREKIEQPLALILGPTRELCVQIETQAKELSKGLPIRTALIVGGMPLPQQFHRLKKGCQLILATPGRLIDVLLQYEVPLENVSSLVLDEVDIMLEMGFREQVMQIVRALSQPQLLLFSATIPAAIEKFAASLLQRPIYISVGNRNAPSRSVKQTIIWCENRQKKQKLFDILLSPRHFHPPTLVMVDSKLGADILAESINLVTGLKTVSIHGDKPMSERITLLNNFVMGDLPLVVATGVLGRGLDLIHVKQVILFDLPNSVDEYVHQIGRAGRLGRPGSAIVFVNSEDRRLFKELVHLFKEGGSVLPREMVNSVGLPQKTSSLSEKNRKRKLR